MFWAVSGQFGRFCFRLWKGFGKFNFRTTFVKHVAVTPCNSDVVTANISKHQLTSPRLGIKTCADFFACIVPQTLLGITPVFFLKWIFHLPNLQSLPFTGLRPQGTCAVSPSYMANGFARDLCGHRSRRSKCILDGRRHAPRCAEIVSS